MIGRAGAALGLVAALTTRAHAQTSPFVPDALFRGLINEISGDRSYENVRSLTHFHRTGGSKDFFKAAEWIRQAAVEAGLEDVRLIRQKYDGQAWSCARGEARILGPDEMMLASYGEIAVSIADNSRTTHATADLVDVGPGLSDADYQGRDVKDKIVLTSGSVSAVHREAVWKRGALGVISSQSNRPEPFDAPEQVAWASIPYEAKGMAGVRDGTPGTFGVMISPRRARIVQKRLQSGPARVRVDIESSFASPAQQAMVEGWIRGTEIHDQQVVLTAHIQEEMTSANDDGSGCGNVLEIGRALVRLMKDGKIARPRRDVRFWWVSEFSSEEQFFRENPGEPKKMLLDINQDMVGGRQSWGGRVQYGSRLPWSLPHALDDVMESVLTLVRDSNTSLLTTRGTAAPQPYSREIVAVKGSREPFHARMVPYYNSTDHHAFTPAHIGVPATSLTNWPDEFIHGTGDDLENIDATQLERNAVVVASVAWYFASLKDQDLPGLAAYVAARGRARVAADGATAVATLMESPDGTTAYHSGRNLLAHSARKEAGALESVGRIAPSMSSLRALLQAAIAETEKLAASQQSLLDDAFVATAGAAAPPKRTLSADETFLDARVYAPVSGIGVVQDALGRLDRTDGLHSMMRFEALNFADGKRTGLQVLDAVAAEAASAGEWYYGKVGAADVKDLLERAARAGVVTVKERKQ